MQTEKEKKKELRHFTIRELYYTNPNRVDQSTSQGSSSSPRFRVDSAIHEIPEPLCGALR